MVRCVIRSPGCRPSSEARLEASSSTQRTVPPVVNVPPPQAGTNNTPAVRPNLLGGAPYGAAKAAVANLMGFMHATFRNNNIRSTTILPGEVDTPIMDTRVRPPTAAERAAMVAPDDVARAILLACTLPQGTTIEQLVISPTLARDQGPDVEISRWLGAPDGKPGKP